MRKARKPIKLGTDVHHVKIDKSGKKVEVKYTYQNLKEECSDEQEWIDCKIALPFPFDLQSIKIKEKCNLKVGWWTGVAWEGLRLKKEDKVIKWKPQGSGMQ